MQRRSLVMGVLARSHLFHFGIGCSPEKSPNEIAHVCLYGDGICVRSMFIIAAQFRGPMISLKKYLDSASSIPHAMHELDVDQIASEAIAALRSACTGERPLLGRIRSTRRIKPSRPVARFLEGQRSGIPITRTQTSSRCMVAGSGGCVDHHTAAFSGCEWESSFRPIHRRNHRVFFSSSNLEFLPNRREG